MSALPDVQLVMSVDDPDAMRREQEREAEDQQELLARFFKACREVCREHTYERVAEELERIWGDLGRHVSSGVLKQTLAPGNERNYFRFEWCIWFARQSDSCAEILKEIIGHGQPKKSPEEELRDLQTELRAELSHKRAEQLIRRARGR